MKTLKQLFETLPQQGTVTWIGVRPARRTEMQSLEHVLATPAVSYTHLTLPTTPYV